MGIRGSMENPRTGMVRTVGVLHKPLFPSSSRRALHKQPVHIIGEPALSLWERAERDAFCRARVRASARYVESCPHLAVIWRLCKALLFEEGWQGHQEIIAKLP
jgi:hypothetical protein